MTAGSTTTDFRAELDLEGVLNGNFNSRVDVPAILPPPTLTAPLAPTSGGVGQVVTVNGTNFGAVQGTSTLRFNTTTATPATWTATSITAPVPSGATTGNVTVTVAGQASNGLAFTVLPTPTITSLSPTSGGVGVAVTINGTNFGATQGTSTVTFNGTPVTTITSWTATRVVTAVPAGASTGPVRVTVNGVPSAGTTFTVPVPPAITSVTPPAASAPAAVTIAGTGFGATQGTSTVRFNGTTATATAWSATSITATIPTAATTGPLVVTVGGVASNSFSYTVPPQITSVSPDPAADGAVMTITGTNFGATKGTSTLTFGGNLWNTTSWSATQIQAVVGTSPAVVTVNGVASAPRAFTLVPPPTLNPPIPEQAAVGSVLTLTGINFGAVQSTSTVRINGALATATSWSDTEIKAAIPAGATATGNITVTVGGVGSSTPFTVVPAPQITTLSAPSGLPGTPVVITGSGFGSGPSYSRGGNTVTFDGVVATVNAWTATSISTVVPLGARSGPVVVTVGIDVSNSVAFTVPYGPSLQSLTPNAGSPGTSVTLTGLDLGTSGTVTFNGLSATTTAWTPTSVTATVPSGASTGPVVVTVSGAPSNGLPFTVLGTGSVSGTVTNAVGGAPIGGVTVQGWQQGILKGSATSTGAGTYVLSLATGTYDLTFTATGFGTHVVPALSVSTAGGAPVNVALAAGGSIAGIVTESNGATPIPNAAVIVTRGTTLVGSAVTSSTGTYTVAGLGASAYRVEMMAAGYVPRSQPAVAVAAGAATTLNVSLSGPGLAPIQYVYDDVGRLKAVIDRGGDAAVYTYDPVGNILAIERQSSSDASIVAMKPSRGVVGSTVQIVGTGFGAVPSQNTVSFNGVAAVVTASTATSLTVTVPFGATTGPVSVTTPVGTAASPGVFTVVADSGAPTITGLTPTNSDYFGSVQITGTNFGTAATTRVYFNGTRALSLSAVTSTSLTVLVPGGASSGRVTVSTAFGAATSSQDFFVTPAGAPVGFMGRVAVGSFIDVPLSNTAYSTILFDGVAGQRITAGVEFTGTTGTCVMHLVGPNNYSVQMGGICADEPPTVVTLPATATYTLRATLGASGTARIRVYDVPPDLAGTLSPGGTPVNLATTPGQKAVYTFTSPIGTDLGLTFANNTYASCWFYVNAPDGSSVVSRACASAGHVNLPPLLSTQAYTVIVQPWRASAGGGVLSLLAPVTAALTIDGSPVTLATTVAGQSAQFSFSGVAGQRVGALATADTFPQCLQFSLVRPDGTVQAVPPSGCWGGLFLGAETLASTGTYWVVREPNSAVTGSTTMRVVTVPADVSDTATVGGPARTLTTTALGQDATLSFTGTAGQSVTFQASGSTLGMARLTLRRPDGTEPNQWFLSGTSGGFAAGTLSMTLSGTYVLTIDPLGGSVGSVTIAIVTP